MKRLVVFSTILAVVAASYPVVQTWSMKQLIYATDGDKTIDRSYLPCLGVALDPVMKAATDKEFIGKGTVIIPAPSGAVNWTVPELTNAANIISIYMGLDINSRVNDHDDNFWTSEELEEALVLFPFYQPFHVDLSEERRALEMHLCILSTLYDVTTAVKDFDLKKDTTKVLFPAIDISIWNADALNKAIREPRTKPRIIPYLKIARRNPKQSLDDGKNVCVVTPVGLMPQAEPNYYIPKATRRLLELARVKEPLSMRPMGERSLEVSETRRTLPLFYN